MRGKWILENLLNAPPPPPPPAVPSLDDTKVGQSGYAAAADGGASQESGVRLVPFAHGPARIRPREFQRDRRLAHEDGKFPVDASGALPGGRSFQGPVELKALL